MGGRARSQLLIVAAEVVIIDLSPGYKERDFSDEEEISAAPEQYQVAGAWSFIAARGQNRPAIGTTRAALGEEAFDVAWAHGRRLSREQATDEALQTAESLRLVPT